MNTQITIAQFEQARINLSAYMLRKADQIARQCGFGYKDVPDAPNDYAALLAAWADSKRTGLALPVWDGCSDNTVYTSRGANYAFRFWHDVLHCVHGLGFNTDDEITLGLMQVADVKMYFGPDSVEAEIMHVDTVGQSKYAARNNGEFPSNQFEFVKDCVMYPHTARFVHM